MSQPIQRQADQWSLPDRQASSSYEPSQAELRDLLGGPRIQSGLLNTREASRKQAEQISSPGYPDALKEHPEFQKWLAEHPNFHEWLDEKVLYPIWLEEHQNVGPGRVTEASQRLAVPRENPAGDLNMSPRKLDQQVTQQVQNKALKPPKPKPIPDDLGQDQSFKVPNQLKAHRDPQLPPRGYLASFVRQADASSGGASTSDIEKMMFPDGKPKNWGSATDSSPKTMPAGAPAPAQSNAYVPPIMTTPGSPLIGQPPLPPKSGPAPVAGPNPAPATDVSSISAPAPKGDQSSSVTRTVSDTKPSTGGGADTSWTARDIAPGSIDTSKDYTVQKGDTLAEIAQGAGIKDYNDIAKANNIADPNKINEGQVLHFSPAPGGPSTPVSETPSAASASGESGSAPTPSAGTPDVGGAASAVSAPLPAEVGGTPPTPTEKKSSYDPPLPPKGQLKKFLVGSRHLADTEEERKKGTQYSPENTNPGLNNPAAPAPGGGQPNTPWFTPPAPSSSDAAPGPTPSQKAGEPIKPPTPTAAPSQPTSPNTPASSDATQNAPVKTNDLSNASNPNSSKPSEPAGNPAQPASPSGTDKPKTPGSYGPDIGNGFSLSDAMGVIGGIGQGINTAISSIGTIGSGLMGALSGGGLGSLISGFGGLGMLGSTLGITAAAQQQIEASERVVKEQYV